MTEPGDELYDPVPALRILVEHGVRFVVIGGVGGRAWGSPLITQDLDICYERTPENLERLAAALQAIHARLRGVEDDVPFLLDAETLQAGDFFTFVTDVGPLDILGTPAGTRGHDHLAEFAKAVDVGGVTVLVAALGDLIRMKLAAGRPKDRVAVETLEALRNELEGWPDVWPNNPDNPANKE